MVDIEVHLGIDGGTRQMGRARSNRVRGKETVVFEYADEWWRDAERFALEPELPLTRGGFAPPAGRAIHGSLGDSAPDTWGRRLMHKFAYDLWGDAVNTAARMESHGEAGKIHVSEEFASAAGERFSFTERGEMEVKGKGVMRTFFLQSTSTP